MVVKKLSSGKVLVYYEDIGEAIEQRSCIACRNYDVRLPCPFYKSCRAEKKPSDRPLFFNFLGYDTLRKRIEEGYYGV